MEPIIVVGGGGHAKVLISVIKKMSSFTLLGYTDTTDKGPILSAEYLGSDEILADFYKRGAVRYAALGVGAISTMNGRRKIINNILSIGYAFPPIISPNAIVHDSVQIGSGTMVFDGSIINAGALVGDFSIINTGVILEHDCSVGDYVHIAPGAIVCGGSAIGNNSMIGAGSTVIHSVSISADTMIGGGSVVVKNCDSPGLYFGNPAKFIR